VCRSFFHADVDVLTKPASNLVLQLLHPNTVNATQIPNRPFVLRPPGEPPRPLPILDPINLVFRGRRGIRPHRHVQRQNQ
jgi:hypothetical protein